MTMIEPTKLFPRYAAILAGLLLGCGGSGKPAAGAENPCAVNPCGHPCGDADGEAPDVSGWGSWTKINDARFLSKTHNNTYVDVYVDAYRAGRGEVGMTVAKVQYPSEAAAAPASITVMQKMQQGYDAGSGDWWYGVYDPDGRTAKMQGKVAACKNCHVNAGGGDYLYSDDVAGN